jgi:hypothetical protein
MDMLDMQVIVRLLVLEVQRFDFLHIKHLRPARAKVISDYPHNADERAFDPMREPAVFCTVIRPGCGVKRTQARQTEFPVMAVAPAAQVSQMAHVGKCSSGGGYGAPLAAIRVDVQRSRRRFVYRGTGDCSFLPMLDVRALASSCMPRRSGRMSVVLPG